MAENEKDIQKQKIDPPITEEEERLAVTAFLCAQARVIHEGGSAIFDESSLYMLEEIASGNLRFPPELGEGMRDSIIQAHRKIEEIKNKGEF